VENQIKIRITYNNKQRMSFLQNKGDFYLLIQRSLKKQIFGQKKQLNNADGASQRVNQETPVQG
jgi:hypothetical protein